jgi:plasmid stability protein
MAELRIRNIDDWIIDHHRHNARKKGITLGEEIKAVLSDSVVARRQKRVEELRKNAEALRAKYGTFPSSVPYIREMREGI